MVIREALALFGAEMLAKFQERAERHPDNDVIANGTQRLRGTDIIAHLWDEVREFMESPDVKEAVDVANMAFLAWWVCHERGTNSLAGGLECRNTPRKGRKRMTIASNMSRADAARFFGHLVEVERAAQDEKWGEQHHSMPEWACILAEEMGEFAKEAGEWHWREGDGLKLANELVQCAAVCQSIFEDLAGPSQGPNGGAQVVS